MKILITGGVKMKSILKRMITKLIAMFTINTKAKLENIELQNGKILEELLNHKKIEKIEDAEFKVFSQFGEDGIISYLTSILDIKNKTFIEFGVEDYSESNARFLMMNQNWRGLIIDGSKGNINHVISNYYFWKYDLTAINEFITAENINDLLVSNLPNQNKHVGLLSIDIDGNDYWVFKEIKDVSADILILEYNSFFGFEKQLTVPYDPKFYRYNYSFTGAYFGASLPALIEIAKEKGYFFAGTCAAGHNAFFINNQHIDKFNLTTCMNQAKFRQPTNVKEKKLLNKYECLTEIKDLELIDLDTNIKMKINNLVL